MKVEELILAKCIKNEENDFVLGQFYKVDEIHIGQSYTEIIIDNKSYNSVMFEFYDKQNNEINIYNRYNHYKGFYTKKEDVK